VNANDVVYGTKRTINPETASDYAYVLYGIKNAQAINEGSEEFTLDDLGVAALDDTTVQFTLESPAPWFPGIASMWITFPLPSTPMGYRRRSGRQVDRGWHHCHQRTIRNGKLDSWW
jgi:ABC-type oligopeptide transport system substrate-binding subunit